MSHYPAHWRIALVLCVIVLLSVVDVALGSLGRRVDDYRTRRVGQRTEDVERAYRRRHPYYDHDLVPRYSGSAAWGPRDYAIRTNSLGFRDESPREIPSRTSAFRLILIGDSFTEGSGVEWDSTFAGILARQYAPEGVDLLNAGVDSYSPAIYWKKIEYLLERESVQMDAVVVFLDMSDINDEAWGYRIDAAGHVIEGTYHELTGWNRWLRLWRHNSLTYSAAARAVRTLWPPASSAVCPDIPVDCRAAWATSPEVMDLYGRDGLRRADEHLTRLAALLRARGIPLTLVVYPWPQQLRWNDRSSLQVTYWEQWARREQVDFIELFTAFFAQADALGTDEAMTRFFIPDDIHWNTQGHRVVADAFARRYTGPWRRAHGR